jgi:hypothetical protein
MGGIWFKLMFIATHLINLECVFRHIMGPDVYDVYVVMTCTLMLLMMFLKITKSMCVYFRTKQKLKFTYKYMLRMKLALLLREW